MQFGQRVAAIGMVVWQNGHSLVVGSAGAGARFILLAARIRRIDRECDDQKIDDVIEKYAVADGCVSGRFRFSQSGVMAA